MVPDEFVEMARAYQVLSDLGPEQLRKLLPLAEENQYAGGQIIFHEGDRSAFLHLIVKGEVALEQARGGAPVQKLHAGDAMGWSALTLGHTTHFQARALAPVTTVSFAADHLLKACDADPAMGYALVKRLLELVTERLDALRMKSAA